jgi:hypothetical protein
MRRKRPNIGADQGLLIMTGSDLALSVVLGVVLAAATGFRVFLPMRAGAERRDEEERRGLVRGE